MPSVGELGLAWTRLGMSPAVCALRPASTPPAMASAISGGSCARAIAVLTSTASAPISMASAASDGDPIPASTTTGTVASSMMIRICCRVCSPCAEPMGEPNGITVTVPISSSFFASTGSAHGHSHQLAPGGLERRHHGLVVGVLARAQEQARAQLDAGDDQAVRRGCLHEFSLDAEQPRSLLQGI